MNITRFLPLGRQSTAGQVQSTENRNEDNSAHPTQQGTPTLLGSLNAKSKSASPNGGNPNISNNRNEKSASNGAAPSSFKKSTLKTKAIISQKLTRTNAQLSLSTNDALSDISKKYRQIVPNKETRKQKKSDEYQLQQAARNKRKDLGNITEKIENLEQEKILLEDHKTSPEKKLNNGKKIIDIEKRLAGVNSKYKEELKTYTGALFDLNIIDQGFIPPPPKKKYNFHEQ